MLVLALAYPVLAHVAASGGSSALTLASAALLAFLVLAPGAARRRPWALAAVPFTLLALYALSRAHLELLPLFLPPVLLNLYMAWLFGHTLAGGRVPLIERLARLVRGDEPWDPRITPYARKLTAVWTALFVAIAATNAVLALLARPNGLLFALGIEPPVAVPIAWWSLFANLINYALVALLFGVEYLVRHRLFPERPYDNFADFTRRMIAIGPRLWRDIRTEA